MLQSKTAKASQVYLTNDVSSTEKGGGFKHYVHSLIFTYSSSFLLYFESIGNIVIRIIWLSINKTHQRRMTTNCKPICVCKRVWKLLNFRMNGYNCISYKKDYEWVGRFRGGRMSVDEARSGRLSIVTCEGWVTVWAYLWQALINPSSKMTISLGKVQCQSGLRLNLKHSILLESGKFVDRWIQYVEK